MVSPATTAWQAKPNGVYRQAVDLSLGLGELVGGQYPAETFEHRGHLPVRADPRKQEPDEHSAVGEDHWHQRGEGEPAREPEPGQACER